MQDQIEQILIKAHSACQQSGGRLTDKRRNVLLVLLRAQMPLSAYEIVDKYKEQFDDNIPAMSVYRMLNFLLEADLVHKLETTNQFLACSHIACEHKHEVPQFLICDKCHAVSEVSVHQQIISELKNSIEKTGFMMASQQLELHGICPSCQPSKP